MTYRVNGVDLDGARWHMSRGSVPILSLSMDHTVSRQAGRDGVTFQGGTHGSAEMRFLLKVDRAYRDALFAVFRSPVLVVTDTDRPGRTATGVLRGSSMENHYDFLDFDEELFVIEVGDGCWRGSEVTTALTPAAAAGAALSLFTGLSAPVQDALIRVQGPITDPEVTDTSGSFFSLDGSLAGSEFLRFESATGRAFVTATDVWTGGDEMSGLVDFGGPRGVFEITPRFPTPADPTVREGRLTLRQTTFSSGAGFRVRGRSAHLM